jgi:tripartite-type tricarboxylate transporter receptor subunit TctC
MRRHFPTKPVRWIVPSSPGDGADVVARLFADRMGRVLGQPVIVENKSGAGGVIGSEYVSKAAPDGYTMIVGNAGSQGINAAIYRHFPYDVTKDFTPIALMCVGPNVMVVGPKVPVKSVAEFIAYAKAHPGTLDYSSGGVGSSAHMSAELFKNMTGVEMTHVPYKGGVPATQAVLSGEVSVMIGNLLPWMEYLKSGQATALAVTTSHRVSQLPAVPAMAETLPGFETVAWFGLLGPANLPAPIVKRMNAEVNKILAEDDIKSRLTSLGCDPAPGTPESYDARIKNDVARWKKLAREQNIQAD